MLKKLYNLIETIHLDPFTLKKAILLCLFVEGIWFISGWFFSKINLAFGLLPYIFFLATTLLTARMMGKDELRRIFAWRDIPLPVFSGIMIMFFGFEIISSELNNVLQNILPITEGFFDGAFYVPDNIFVVILSIALLPGFTEEILFRGIIARRFYRTYSPIKSILLSAALFGIFHQNPWQAVNAFYLGIFLGWIYWRYRSIWICMFSHAYSNILATFMPYPYVAIENSNYLDLWRHPLWFDIMGLLLFALGLIMVIVLSRKKKAEEKDAVTDKTKIINGELK